MKTNTVKTATYWTCTGLLVLNFLVGGAFQMTRPPQAVQGFAHLGYPAYFMSLLGLWKVLGAIALLVPRFPRLKEWAYAGIFFDVTTAAVSVIAVGDGWAAALLPLAFVPLTLASWALRPVSRTLMSAPSTRSEAAILGTSENLA